MDRSKLIKIFKNKNNRTIFIIFIIGVALMIAAHSFSGKKAQPEPQAAETAVYTADEEKRLADMLSKIEGAGSVSVMITYNSGTEKNLAYETKTSEREGSGERSEDKKAVTSDGEPVVVKEVYPSVKGIIIAADGADKPQVKTAIREAVVALTGVAAHRVCIFKKEEE